jgi:hyperosmotically inducible protein
MKTLKTENEIKNTTKNVGCHIPLRAALCCVGAALALGMTGCSTTGSVAGDSTSAGPAQVAGAQEDDRNTTSLVNTALAADPEYKFDTVNVTTSAGIVQLSGFVISAEQKTQAGFVAKNVATVKDVVNSITVKPPAS